MTDNNIESVNISLRLDRSTLERVQELLALAAKKHHSVFQRPTQSTILRQAIDLGLNAIEGENKVDDESST